MIRKAAARFTFDVWGRIVIAMLFIATAYGVTMTQTTQEVGPFPPPKHEPPVVTPGKNPGDPPYDAVILFDGTNLSRWKSVNTGGDAGWKVKDGYMEVAVGSGAVATRNRLGGCMLQKQLQRASRV